MAARTDAQRIVVSSTGLGTSHDDDRCGSIMNREEKLAGYRKEGYLPGTY